MKTPAMPASNFDLHHIATLARLKISDAETAAFNAGFADILHLFDKIQTVDTKGIEPMAHPLNLSQRLRQDIVTETDKHVAFQAIAPAVDNDLYLVPKVIGDH